MIATDEPMLQTELWVSFVSMLRSYAAAASLQAGEVRVSTTENTVKIAAGANHLEMRFDAESCEIAWTLSIGSQASSTGSFTIRNEGTIQVNDITKDLDHAAIDFIASVTAEGKGSRP